MNGGNTSEATSSLSLDAVAACAVSDVSSSSSSSCNGIPTTPGGTVEVPHTHVFIKDDAQGWVPAKLLFQSEFDATVILLSPSSIGPRDEHDGQQAPVNKSAKAVDSSSSSDDVSNGVPELIGASFSSSESDSFHQQSNHNRLRSPRSQSGLSRRRRWARQQSAPVSSFQRVSRGADLLSSSSLSASSSSSFVYRRASQQDALDRYLGESDHLDAIVVKLSDYPNRALPLMDLDEETGRMVSCGDMTDLPFLHEASILYNLKERFERGDVSASDVVSPVKREKCSCVPYTRSGDIVVAVNPYRWIEGLYAEKTRRYYAEQVVWEANPSSGQEIPPHIYEASAQAYRGLLTDGRDQSILVSGESGAGKTVSVRILMSHLAMFESTRRKNFVNRKMPSKVDDGMVQLSWGSIMRRVSSQFVHTLGQLRRDGVSHSRVPDEGGDELGEETYNPEFEPEEMSQDNPIVQKVIDSNPLLEAFGNAKTARNDNSSRFGKYVRLQFRMEYEGSAMPSCCIAGSTCETYLLEKSRVVRHEPEERTYHIFYQLLSAPDETKADVWKGLCGKDASSFRYVGASSTNIIEGMTDARRWTKTLDALKLVGITDDTLEDLLKALCVVLQLGNVTFDVDPTNDEGSVVSSPEELEMLSEIIGVSAEDLTASMTKRKVVAPDEVYSVPITPTAAGDVRDAFAKEIYTRVFDWLVAAINVATSAESIEDVDAVEKGSVENGGGRLATIGLLDIFGFETFETNRFEQLCINHANEKLQQKFTQDVFRSVQLEYQSEGIDLCEVHFDDNSHVLDLVEGRLGLIDILNEECIRPRGSDTGFVNKVYSNNKSRHKSALLENPRYRRHEFGVSHFAGPVVYDASNFVAKNLDALPDEVVDCARRCSNGIINDAFRVDKVAGEVSAQKRKKTIIAHTVWTKFRRQLGELMDSIGRTQTRYVRCINPNTEKKPGKFDLGHTFSQLRFSGILSAVTISRESFPNRLTFQTAFERFALLASCKNLNVPERLSERDEDNKEYIDSMLASLLKSMKYVSENGEVSSPFICGRTKVYFRPGALEHLESDLRTVFDRYAAKIQARVRRNVAVSQYRVLRMNTQKFNQMQKRARHQVWAAGMFVVSFLLPLPLLIWRRFGPMPRWARIGHR